MNMKKYVLLLVACIGGMLTYAQGEIQFSILKAAQSELPQSVIDALDMKLKQVLTRNKAASSNQYNVFVIEPTIEIGESLASAGLMEQVRLVKGEVTLMVKNKVDGSLYHSLTIPVSGDVAGDEEKCMKAMITNIKSTDPSFTRFVRVAREKIQDYYASNCSSILQKAKGLYDMKKYQDALSYLSAISENLPCYEQAAVLQAELAQYMPEGPDTVIIQKVIEKVVEKPVEVEKIVEVERIVERVVEKPVIVEKIVEKPVVVSERKPEYEISISTNTLKFKVLKCYGNATQKRITILAEIVNEDTNRNQEEYLNFVSCITDGGTELKNFEMQDRSSWVKLPPRVTVRREFYVTNVYDKFSTFSYLELKIGNATVSIRNLPVKW